MAISKAVGIIKNLKLTKKDILMIIGIVILLCSIWTANYYRNEGIHLQTILSTTKKQLEIERNNPKIKQKEEEIKVLQQERARSNKELVVLYRELKNLSSIAVTYTQIVEGLGEINDTEDSCNALASIGHPICGKLEIIRRD